jgi:CCR4-NOT transcriptional regulation complex NOT5 subunit
MENIKEELKTMIDETMIPETMDYIEEIKLKKNNNTATQDDLNGIEEMQFFLEELEHIVKGLEEDKISEEDAKTIYEKIQTMVEEHSEH